MHFIDEIKNRAQMEIKTIALPEAYDERVLKAAVKAESEKIAKIILVGDRKKTLKFAEEKNIDITQIKYIDIRFRQDTGEKIGDYIQKFRVERAANLLKYSDATLSEISDYVCFNSQSHFGSVFKEYMKMTPRQYREKYKRKEFYS